MQKRIIIITHLNISSVFSTIWIQLRRGKKTIHSKHFIKYYHYFEMILTHSQSKTLQLLFFAVITIRYDFLNSSTEMNRYTECQTPSTSNMNKFAWQLPSFSANDFCHHILLSCNKKKRRSQTPWYIHK